MSDETSQQVEIIGTPLETIPGIGPIRVRALRKAGFRDLESLQTISVGEIAGIRGLTEIKAQFIVEFVTGYFAPLPIANNPKKSKSDTPKAKKSTPLGDKPASVAAAEEPKSAPLIITVVAEITKQQPKVSAPEPFQPMIALVQIATTAAVILKKNTDLPDGLKAQLTKLTSIPSKVKRTIKPDNKRFKVVEKQCAILHLLLEGAEVAQMDTDKLASEIRTSRRKLLEAVE